MKQSLSICQKNHKKPPHVCFDACRDYSKALKAKKSFENFKNIHKHERMFRNNPWLYARKCCSGGNTQGEPVFSAETAYAHFRSTASSRLHLHQTIPEWVSQVIPTIESDELIEFNLSGISPGTIRKVLKGHPSNSSPCRGR